MDNSTFTDYIMSKLDLRVEELRKLEGERNKAKEEEWYRKFDKIFNKEEES